MDQGYIVFNPDGTQPENMLVLIMDKDGREVSIRCGMHGSGKDLLVMLGSMTIAVTENLMNAKKDKITNEMVESLVKDVIVTALTEMDVKRFVSNMYAEDEK